MYDPHSKEAIERVNRLFENTNVSLMVQILRDLYVKGGATDDTMAAIDQLGLTTFHYAHNAFFLNVAERVFTGHESPQKVATHITKLKRHHDELADVDPDVAAQLVLAGIGSLVPSPDFPRIHMTPMKAALATAFIASTTLGGALLDSCIHGATARAIQLMVADGY
ncbi:hypothetical protein [Stackebrandtia soli]|uniref:hypothetical protein n=1 Tax=Stackebrandtia soli TaxID=1892856 RepID=UPI0039EC08FE